MALHTFVAGEEITAANLNASFVSRVGNTGNETIAGIKTFSSIPVLPASDPTTDNQATRKAYTDSLRVPVGAVFPFAGSSAPANYLLCDGSAVSRTTYATLFAVIGTTFGAGDGSTTFNLPDLKGRVPVGKDAGTFSALAGTGGEETHTLSEAEMPAHTHTIQSQKRGPDDGSGNEQSPALSSIFDPTKEPVWNNTPHMRNTSKGSGSAHNNLQPYIVLNYIIKC